MSNQNQKQPIMTEDERLTFGLLLAILSLIVGPLAAAFAGNGFEVGGLIAFFAAVVTFFVGLGLMGVFKELFEFLGFGS